MNSGRNRFPARFDRSRNDLCATIDRRRFLQYAAGMGAAVSLGVAMPGWAQEAAGGQARTISSGSSDDRLPDGTYYTSWEKPLRFNRTYYVDTQSDRASDSGPGTLDRPFKTINQAAQVLQPGERVIIAAGTYRECVRPARGGSSPTQMISYEAAPGAAVFIKGSDVLKDAWQPDPVQQGRGGPSPIAGAPATPAPTAAPTWGYQFTGAMFPDAYNPFALPSVAGDRAWLDSKSVDMGPYFRRRGLVFVNGKPLEPVEQQRELIGAKLYMPPPSGTPRPLNGLPTRARGGPLMQEVGGTENARFYTDADGRSIHIRLAQGTPTDYQIEVTTREQAFAPTIRGLSYIRIKGLTFQHAGNGFPLPQRGTMVDTAAGTHWIIEDNTFEWANSIGLQIGGGGGFGAQQVPNAHIVRRNTMRYCGVCGVAGMGSRDVLFEDNLIEWCGWADAEREWESAGAKFHSARNMMFRRNVVRHIRHGNAVWFDSNNVNNRLTGNVFADIVTVSAAVHFEVNLGENQVDNSIIWNVRNAEPGTGGQRGCAGSGVFINASNRVIVAQNLIGQCDNAGVWSIVRPDRAGTGTATDNIISNNIFDSCEKAGIVFLSTQNQADGNVYVAMPGNFQGFFTGDNRLLLALASWRDTYGWDKNSVVFDMQIQFDPDTLQLTVKNSQLMPKVAGVNRIENDMFGKVTGETRVAGPIAVPSSKSVWQVDSHFAHKA